jgi:hypothetical protein
MSAFRDGMLGVLDGVDYVNQGFEQGRQRKKQNALAQLSGDYIENPTTNGLAALARAGGNPAPLAQMGEQQQEAQRRQIGEAAALLVSAPAQMRGQVYVSRVLPYLRQNGLEAPEAWDDSLLPVAQQLAQQLGGGQGQQLPADIQTMEYYRRNPEAYQMQMELRRAAANQYGFQVLEGPDGVQRLVQTNKREGGAAPIGPAGAPVSPGSRPSAVSLAGELRQFGATITSGYRDPAKNRDVGGVANSQHMSGTAFDAVIPPAIKAQAIEYGRSQGYEVIDEGDHVHFELPSGANIFEGRRAEDVKGAEVAASKRAELAVDQERAGFDVEQAAAVKRAEATATRQAERGDEQVGKRQAFEVYQTAMAGLRKSLAGTTTGPIAGRLPALTAAQQTADGGVAAIAPVLKQLFRSAGEGVFTDKDQELLMRMIPTRTDHPAARQAKMDNIDAIVKAKLSAMQAPAAVAPNPTIDALLDKYK